MIGCIVMEDGRTASPMAGTALHDHECRLVIRPECSGNGGMVMDEPRGLLALGEGRIFGEEPKTAVAAQALRHYVARGHKGITSMRGEFAAIIYDLRRHGLTAIADPLGKFPLYYESGAGRIAAGTSLSWFGKRKDLANLDPIYMAVNLVQGPRAAGRTPFLDVRRLPLGSAMTWGGRERRPQIARHWWPVPTPLLPEELCAERVRAALSEAVADRVRQHPGPIGVSLSGGLDSSCVYAMAATTMGRAPVALHLTYTTPGCDELEYARAVVDRYAGRLVPINAEQTWLFRDFPDWPQTGEPSHTIAHGLVGLMAAAAAENGVDLVLNGEGGDHFFFTPPDFVFPDTLCWAHPLRSSRTLLSKARQHNLSYVDAARRFLVWPLTAPERFGPTGSAFFTTTARRHCQRIRLRARGSAQRWTELSLLWSMPPGDTPQPEATSSPFFDPRVIEAAAAMPGSLR